MQRQAQKPRGQQTAAAARETRGANALSRWTLSAHSGHLGQRLGGLQRERWWRAAWSPDTATSAGLGHCDDGVVQVHVDPSQDDKRSVTGRCCRVAEHPLPARAHFCGALLSPKKQHEDYWMARRAGEKRCSACVKAATRLRAMSEFARGVRRLPANTNKNARVRSLATWVSVA